jgi:hypothetical protein
MSWLLILSRHKTRTRDLWNTRRETQIQRETNWSSKNGGFADGLVTLPRKTKYSKAKTHSLGNSNIKFKIDFLKKSAFFVVV